VTRQFQNIVRTACSMFLQIKLKKTEYPVVWAQSASDGRRGSVLGSRYSAASTLVNHLATCDYQTAQVVERASLDPSCTLTKSRCQNLNIAVIPPSSQGPSQPSFPTGSAIPPSYPPQYTGLASSSGPSTFSSELYPGSESMDNSNQLHLIFNSRPATPLMTPDFLRRDDSMSTLFPEDSASAIASTTSHDSSLSARRPHSHPPSSRIGINTPRLSSGQLWSSSSQTEFENHIARITVSANLPLSWVDNLEVVTFMDKYIPAATAPSRKVLTKRIIPNLADELQTAAKKETRGKNATLQADGWTGGNHRHLVAFMITAEKKVWRRSSTL
jgi:hypothetical protein